MRQLVYEKENPELKPVKLRLKIDLVSYPARAEGLGKYGTHVVTPVYVGEGNGWYRKTTHFSIFSVL